MRALNIRYYFWKRKFYKSKETIICIPKFYKLKEIDKALTTLHRTKSGNNCATRKFYVRRNNIKLDSVEKGLIVIAHLLP